MRKYLFILGLICSCCYAAKLVAQDQTGAESGRRVIRKVEPHYPELARRLNLRGTVKVIAVVGADGNVKKVEAVGGSPILVDAAQSAISQWRYAPGSDSREPIELHFTP